MSFTDIRTKSTEFISFCLHLVKSPKKTHYYTLTMLIIPVSSAHWQLLKALCCFETRKASSMISWSFYECRNAVQFWRNRRNCSSTYANLFSSRSANGPILYFFFVCFCGFQGQFASTCFLLLSRLIDTDWSHNAIERLKTLQGRPSARWILRDPRREEESSAVASNYFYMPRLVFLRRAVT